VKIDCHVHVLAATPGRGYLSGYLRRRPNVLLTRILLRVPLFGSDEQIERVFEDRLVRTIDGTPELDAAVGLAFDAVYGEDGRRDENTHLYVTNEYAAELARKHPKLLLGASVHPYRKDALEELERCVADGAVLMKWLPLVQGWIRRPTGVSRSTRRWPTTSCRCYATPAASCRCRRSSRSTPRPNCSSRR
jgi:uncharacterized protein